MAWPITFGGGERISDWEYFKHFWFAVRERAIAAGQSTFPRGSYVWDSGAISAATATSITDSSKAWMVSPQKRWAGHDSEASGGVAYAPANYDLIIDSCDPTKVIHTQITDNSATVLTIADITQRITERVAPSIASLVGRKYKIIRRGGLWYSERMPTWPNSLIYYSGTVTAAAAGTLSDSAAIFPATLIGKDVLFFETGGALQRGRITAAAGTALTFTGTTGAATVSGFYAVVAADGLFRPNITPDCPTVWYAGAHNDQAYSHMPDDSLAPAHFPTQTVGIYEANDPAFCPAFPAIVQLMDNDVWTGYDNVCASGADIAFNPSVAKSIRFLKKTALDLAGYFMTSDNFDYADSLSPLTAATVLSAAGVNAVGGTITAVASDGSSITVGLGVPWTPINVYWAVIGADGSPVANGYSAYDGTTIAGAYFTADMMGLAVVASLGFTRWVPRTFRRMYPATAFIPDVDDLGGPIDPPIEPGTYSDPDAGPGDWVTRPASDHYLMADDGGFTVDSTLAVDAFADGDYARFVGDNWHDPTISPTDDAADGLDPLSPYYDAFFVGRRAAAAQSALDNMLRGTATWGSATRLDDTSKSWLGGAGRTDSGTATGGSTTTLTDSAKSGSAFWVGANTGGRWLGFTVEVSISGVWHARLINSHNTSTGQIGWADALPATASGKAYRIIEPANVLNRYKGRKVKISSGGSTGEAVISGNSDTSLFFPNIGFTVAAGATYEIVDPLPGGVWARAGGAWVETSGADPRPPHPLFHSNPTENLATLVKRYGLDQKGDAVVLPWLSELRDVLNKMWVTMQGVGFKDDPTVDNAKGGGDSMQGSLGADQINAHNNWAASHGYVAPPPMVTAFLGLGPSYDDAEHSKVVAKLQTDFGAPVDCAVPFTFDWYVYACIDSLDTPPGLNIATTYYFIDNGDPVSYHKWRKFEAGPSVPPLHAESNTFGNLAAEPVWPPTPPMGQNSSGGYYIANQAAIIKWGMTYL